MIVLAKDPGSVPRTYPHGDPQPAIIQCLLLTFVGTRDAHGEHTYKALTHINLKQEAED